MRITFPCTSERYENNNGDWFTVKEVRGTNDIDIVFDEDNIEKNVSKSSILLGAILLPKYRVGMKFHDKKGEEVIISEVHVGKITFQWKDGYERTCQPAVIHNGIMREKDSQVITPRFKVGDIGNLSDGHPYEIVEYKSAQNITIKIKEPREHLVVVTGSNLARGNVYNKYRISTMNGVFGDAKVDSSSKCYRTWVSLLRRVYRSPEHVVAYKDCIICEDWHYLEKFEQWVEQQVYQESWQLDKDLLVKGNKTYAPEFCVFIPKEINTFLTNRYNHRGEWPVGVTYHTRISKWQATCNRDGKSVYLGVFTSPEEAFSAYKKEKEDFAKVLAGRWKGIVDDKVIEKLMEFEVKDTD